MPVTAGKKTAKTTQKLSPRRRRPEWRCPRTATRCRRTSDDEGETDRDHDRKLELQRQVRAAPGDRQRATTTTVIAATGRCGRLRPEQPQALGETEGVEGHGEGLGQEQRHADRRPISRPRQREIM